MTTRIILRRCDLRRDTFRAGGKGGQHQNKTESAVRWTHIPTGIAAESRTERSQRQNERDALRLLVSKLNQMIEDEDRKEQQADYNSKPSASFGHQRRSYWMVDHRSVVDHETGVTEDSDAVVRKGKLDHFIMANIRLSSNL